MSFGSGNILHGVFNKTYRQTGFSVTVEASFALSSDAYSDMSNDATDMYTMSDTVDKMRKHTGFTASVASSFATGAASELGCTWDGTDVYGNNDGGNKNYKYTGFTATIASSVASAGAPRGISIQGGDIYDVNGTSAEKVFHRTGFSATVTESFSPTAASLTGVSRNVDATYLSIFTSAWKHTQHDAFTATISASYAAPGGGGAGLEWDDFTARNDAPTPPAGAFVAQMINF